MTRCWLWQQFLIGGGGGGGQKFIAMYQNIRINVFPTNINIHVNKVCHLISEQILTITTVLIKLLHIHYNAISEKKKNH